MIWARSLGYLNARSLIAPSWSFYLQRISLWQLLLHLWVNRWPDASTAGPDSMWIGEARVRCRKNPPLNRARAPQLFWGKKLDQGFEISASKGEQALKLPTFLGFEVNKPSSAALFSPLVNYVRSIKLWTTIKRLIYPNPIEACCLAKPKKLIEIATHKSSAWEDNKTFCTWGLEPTACFFISNPKTTLSWSLIWAFQQMLADLKRLDFKQKCLHRVQIC